MPTGTWHPWRYSTPSRLKPGVRRLLPFVAKSLSSLRNFACRMHTVALLIGLCLQRSTSCLTSMYFPPSSFFNQARMSFLQWSTNSDESQAFSGGSNTSPSSGSSRDTPLHLLRESGKIFAIKLTRSRELVYFSGRARLRRMSDSKMPYTGCSGGGGAQRLARQSHGASSSRGPRPTRSLRLRE